MEYRLQLEAPAYLIIETPPGYLPHKAVQVDVYEARRFLFDEATKKPNESERWKAVKEWMANKLQIPVDLVAESNCLLLNNTVARLVEEVNKQISKKSEQIVSLPEPTPESLPDTKSGQ